VLKVIVASVVTAIVVAGGAHAYDASVAAPSQVASLQAQVAALQAFNRNCLRAYRIYLSANSDDVMTWGIGLPTPHAARVYGIPATATPQAYC
jgi:outer membrane murein-binding lipoprotein Lpp